MAIHPNWSDFTLQTPTQPGHRLWFHAFCQDCGCEVESCCRCQKRRASMTGHCRICWNSYACPQADDPIHKEIGSMFLCTDCEDHRLYEQLYGPFKRLPKKEVWKYSYKSPCHCCALSSSNFIRTPKFVEIPFHPLVTYTSYKKINARQALEKELRFSGNWAQALLVYCSFFQTCSEKVEKPSLKSFLS